MLCKAVLTGLLFFAATLQLMAAEAPYKPAGFLKMPAGVELGDVSAVAVNSKDHVYVLHRGEPPVLVFDADLNYVSGFGAGMFKTPHGLRIDKNDHVWTTDNGNHVLRMFNAKGRLLRTMGVPGKPGNGNTGFRSPDDLVFDTHGNLYVADAGNGRIVKFDSDGKLLTQWGSKGKKPGMFATTHGLAIDKNNRIYVADRGNKRVQVFDEKGKHLAVYSGFGNPFGLLCLDDKVLVSQGDIHKLYLLDADGKILASWGSPATLKLPHLMAVNSKGTVFVTEVSGQRVQMFKKK